MTFINDIVCDDTRLTTKNDGHLITWELGPCSSTNIFESYTDYVQRCCVLPGPTILTCYNTEKGEGWKSASLTYQGRVYCNDFMSYKTMSHIHVKGEMRPAQRFKWMVRYCEFKKLTKMVLIIFELFIF